MLSAILFGIPLLFSLTVAAPLTGLSELHKRAVSTGSPFQEPALVPASAQTSTLEYTMQNLWNSSRALKHGYYQGKTQKFPLFGSCNVDIPSAINDTLDANIGYGPGTPHPEPLVTPGSVFNVYMFSDAKYRWKSGQDCLKVCGKTVMQAAANGEPSVQCDVWVGESEDGMPGNSHCYAGYAEAVRNGGANATICGS